MLLFMLLNLRNLLLPAIITFVLLLIAQQFQLVLLHYSIIYQSPYWLFAITCVLAAQFNRSRLSLIGLLFLAFYAAKQSGWPDSEFMNHYSELVFSFGIFFISALFGLRDRAFLSVYLLNYVALAVGCFLVACAWLWCVRLWLEPIWVSWMAEHA